MATVIVNGQEIEIGDDERLNGIEAAARAGVDVPRYCWHEGLTVVASCRMCLVESGQRDAESGEIRMMPKLVPACQTPARDGAVFVTDSEKVVAARAMVEEDLLIRHPIDCPICDKAGECALQDYHFEHGRDERRADVRPFTSRRRDLGETVTLFVDRCVVCTRCVRFSREISGTAELMVVNRGAHEEIDVFAGFPLHNKLSGNVVDLCPVGALGDRDFLYQQRVWFMKEHDHVCDGCSTGCSITVNENQDRIYRLKPRHNPEINQWWMCDDGRYGWKHTHDPLRLRGPTARTPSGVENIEWSDATSRLDDALRQAKRLAAVVSPYLTVEEAYLLATYIRSIDPNAVLAVGPIPREGEDESYPNGFTIRAEKCPNRRGVEKVVAGVGGELVTWEQLPDRLEEADSRGLWISGGYRSAWHSDEDAANLADRVDVCIVQDLFDSPLMQRADFRLPGAAGLERDGSYVNSNDRLQSFAWAVRPPAGGQLEGRLLWRLSQRDGLYDARAVLGDVAHEIPFFEMARDAIPTNGVDLRINQLA
ncbi:MAG: 2Fe-2S iron-sulfur cluster-binding protein [Pirellulaceae bacterium]|nr:2Fe-2S iron-sulfur cluster-binding protein [Pirellulaceae bacterium]MDP7016643.1 2Fe-2S iron-sulfur cluster-binding protein [Pirellulaceae bacterium]